ncbi:MAG TPA: 30S ribosomal protein S6 [Solirubrobacteraceae bacterium]|jgi:small subunit ribosomal protein S6|nr:30S ribosomal protein S6 [Solirubrobacteraceae bacterium]
MAESTPLYDLTLVLSVETEDERRAKIVADVESAITSAGGSIERHDDWGRRPMAFRIEHQAEGEYHLFQFHGPVSLLESLSHTLRIDDGVLRFRVIKVQPGTPPAPESAPPIASAPPPVPVAAAAAATTGPGAEIDESAEE